MKKSLESTLLVELAVFPDLGWFDYRCNKPYQHKSMKNQEMILLLLLDSTGIKVANRREWLNAYHKWPVGRKGYLKIHIAVDIKSYFWR